MFLPGWLGRWGALPWRFGPGCWGVKAHWRPPQMYGISDWFCGGPDEKFVCFWGIHGCATGPVPMYFDYYREAEISSLSLACGGVQLRQPQQVTEISCANFQSSLLLILLQICRNRRNEWPDSYWELKCLVTEAEGSFSDLSEGGGGWWLCLCFF